MSRVALKDKRIVELVDQNYVHAYVLFYFGIRFYEYAEETLAEVCRQKGLRVDQVVRELESPTHPREAELPLMSYPIDLIIEYLKHSHFLFIKHKLPYIARLVDSFKAHNDQFATVEKDLKFVFPLFVEDFIHHIYEEEDTLFTYIQTLRRAAKGSGNPSRLFYLMEKNSVQKFAIEHEGHDDEMVGIRRITKDYAVDATVPLHVRVIYNELKDFEKSLVTHARIENEILFPKAMALEHYVKTSYFARARYN